MKKIFLGIAAGLFITTAFAQDWNEDVIEGNGKMVTRDVPVKSFDVLKASGMYELKLSQGATESVKIEADENLQEYFTVKNEGNKLVINMEKMNKKNIRIKNKMRVYITFKKLKELELHTMGKVASEGQLAFEDLNLRSASMGQVDLDLKANKLELKNTGMGKLSLSGSAQQAVVMHSGMGSLDAEDFKVQTMSIENTGMGSARVNAEKELKVTDNWMGRVQNSGSATVRKMNKVELE